MKTIAHIETDFPEKFGIPRQSGLASLVKGKIYFEKPYQNLSAFDGLEAFSHIWILWRFDGVESEHFKAKVRPPKLGGNEYIGVFATRSPFRPNPIGLSCVQLLSIEQDPVWGPVLIVSGADLRNGTAIYDIKPYIPYADSHPEAKGGFAQEHCEDRLEVQFKEDCLEAISVDKQSEIIQILSLDPRPAYQRDPERIYGLSYAGYNISFLVDDSVLTVVKVEKQNT